MVVEVREDILLDGLPFDRGLGDKLGVADGRLKIGGEGNVVEGGVGGVGGRRVVLDGLVVNPLDVLAGLLKLSLVDVIQKDFAPGQRGDGANTMSHLSRAPRPRRGSLHEPTSAGSVVAVGKGVSARSTGQLPLETVTCAAYSILSAIS